LKSHHLIHLSW